MTNLQFISLLTPSIGSVVLVILAWLFANSRLSDLRSDMNRQFDETNRRLSLIERDQKDFFHVTGRLDGRLDELSKK